MTKTLVVEEGAVIDGACRQGYAERTPDKFFGRYMVRMTGTPLDPETYQEAPKSMKKDKPAGGGYTNQNMSLDQMIHG